jgi:hypothetical protein
MEYREEGRASPDATQNVPHDWAERIKKLRWLGLDDEAQRLEAAAAVHLPRDGRRGVSVGPSSTD